MVKILNNLTSILRFFFFLLFHVHYFYFHRGAYPEKKIEQTIIKCHTEISLITKFNSYIDESYDNEGFGLREFKFSISPTLCPTKTYCDNDAQYTSMWCSPCHTFCAVRLLS